MEILTLKNPDGPASKPGPARRRRYALPDGPAGPEQDDHELRVTAVRPAVKDPHRVNIFVNGRFSFSLMLAELADAKLKEGDVLTSDELSDLKKVSDFGKLYQREVEYACTRPHSEKEIRDHLKRKQLKRSLDGKRWDEFLERVKTDSEYHEEVRRKREKFREAKDRQKTRRESRAAAGDFGPDYAENNQFEYSGGPRLDLPKKPAPEITDDDIEKIVARLKRDGVLDDEVFARYYAENRNLLKGASERRLTLELKKKGVSDRIIKNTFETDEFGEKVRNDDDEIEKMLDRKLRRITTEDLEDAEKRQDIKKKILAYLMRQGFSYDLAKTKLETRIEGIRNEV